MEFPAIAGFGVGTSLLFFFGFFSQLRGAHKSMFFWMVGHVDTSTFFFMVFEGLWKLVGRLQSSKN
jgi:hypothetical protein